MPGRRRLTWMSMRNYQSRDYGKRYHNETEEAKDRLRSGELNQEQYDRLQQSIDEKYGWVR